MERRFKEIREERHMTLREAADRLGINPSTLQRYESGAVKQVKYSMLTKMAKVYRCEPAELIGWQVTHEPTGKTVADANTGLKYCVDDSVDADLAVTISRPLGLAVKSGLAFIKATNTYTNGKYYAVRRDGKVSVCKLAFAKGITIIDGVDIVSDPEVLGEVIGVYYEV